MMKEFLKQKLGVEKFIKTINLVESFEKFGESEICQILAIIGKENKDCIKIIQYITVSTPNSSSSPASQTSTQTSVGPKSLNTLKFNRIHNRAKSFQDVSNEDTSSCSSENTYTKV